VRRFLLLIDKLIIKLIGLYIIRDPKFSKVYLLNYELKRLSSSPIPGTWLELDWIANHPWDKYKDFEEDHYLNSFRRQALINEIKEIERKKVVGDFLELGVFKGFSAYTMLVYGGNHRRYFGFDTFAGLSSPKPDIDGTHWKKGDLSFSEKEAISKLRPFGDRVTLIEGEIPAVFQIEPMQGQKFALVHVDLDLYEPTKAALEFGWHRLSYGGSLVCDDYGFETCPGATRAVEEFLFGCDNFDLFESVAGGIVVRKNA
jgi:O-methyltransferase